MPVRTIAITLIALFAAAALLRIYAGPLQRVMAPATERILSKAVLRLPADASDKFIVLTIDDAPSSRTAEIVDLLERYSAHATFFVHTDQIAERESAMENLAAHGHDIGHHMRFDRPAISLSPEDFNEDFTQTDAALKAYGDAAQPFYRPPHAYYRANRMDPALTRHGYDRPLATLGSERRYVLASFIAWDAGGATNSGNKEKDRRTAKRYADLLAANLYPGAIVVFHDGEEDGRAARLDATIYSLELFLKEAKARGYEVLSLSQGISRAAKR